MSRDRTATVTRASALERLWTKLTGDLEFIELYEFSFSEEARYERHRATSKPRPSPSRHETTAQAQENTVLSPRFYTTDFDELDRIDVTPGPRANGTR